MNFSVFHDALAKYFTMLVYVIFNSVTVQIRPIFVYSPLFAGYNAVGYIWKSKNFLKMVISTQGCSEIVR